MVELSLSARMQARLFFLQVSLGLGLVLAPLIACATPADFDLVASQADLATYFPTYLANGYFSTMSSRRGTRATPAFMVALMDYTPGDVSRPALIPGWNGIDYSDGRAWLNRVSLTPSAFRDYRQVLDMHAGTLTTRYRWVSGGRSSDILVSTFVSEADPHLAATRLTLTPRFSGAVHLEFSLRLWPPPAHRFALARLTLAQMQAAVAASGQSLRAVAPATADRAAIWYPGQTEIDASGGSARHRVLWVRGRARHGLAMAEAAAVRFGLPPDTPPPVTRLLKTPHRLALEIRLDVRKGATYTFEKFIAASRADWGAGARTDAVLAEAARRGGFAVLRDQHVAAWHRLWRSDIVISGDPAMQRALHADLFYLLENSTADTAWPMAACGFSPNYLGHVFWDNDSWDFPALLLLHPRRAKSLVMFRYRTLGAAMARAKAHGFRGAMYPWESDPQYGTNQTPRFAWRNALREIHVNADVAIAQWQYYLATGDKTWLRHYGWPVIHAVARFWDSRVTYDAARHRYEILHVVSPDEDYDNVDNDTFTNAVARKALRIAGQAAHVLGVTPDPRWATIAAGLYLPYSPQQDRYLDFGAGVAHDRKTWMGSTLAWLAYPPLDLHMSE
ncbi:Kojibiose phosphorylase, partial [mine drainage metagenome]